jgi:hypothetical protein
MAGTLRLSCLAALAALALGCAPEFDRVSEIETLRILAVQKDQPYARPGELVNLSMLWRDGSDKAQRPISVLWLGGCFNPPGDLFYTCFAGLDPSSVSAKASVCPPDPPNPPEQPRCDNKFSFTMPETILNRPPPSDPTQPRYGLSYVFFAVCAGKLELRPVEHERDFPIACLDESGNRLGPDDFVAGYTAVYAFDLLADDGVRTPEQRVIRNGNPAIDGFFFKDNEVTHRCLEDDCLNAPYWNGLPCGQVPCVPACEDDGDETCPPHKIRPKLVQSEAELAAYPEQDLVSNATRGRNITEQMWINYYAEKGGVKSEVRLLNDAFEGVNDDYGTEFYAPKDPGMTVIWAVVHDNRGGMSWVGTPVLVQAR